MVGAIAGLSLGRFVTADDRTSPPPPAVRTAAGATGDIGALEQAVTERPDDLGAWQALAAAHVRRAIETGDPASYPLAEQALERAEQLAPGNRTTTLERARLALTLHEFAEAARLAEPLYAIEPLDAELLPVLVDASVELGRYDDARRYLQELLDLRPSLPAFARLSYVRELHGDLAGARTAMVQAEQAGSGAPFDLASVIAVQGDLALAAGDLDTADRAYGRALTRVPGLPAAELGQARVLAARGDIDGAVARVEAVSARAPTAGALTLLGELQELAGRPQDAARSFELVQATEQLQEASGSVVDLEAAVFAADRGATERAVDLATRAYDARQTVFTEDALGWALTRAGRPEEALPHVEASLRLGTRWAPLRYHAAAAFAAAGDAERARSELAVAFESAPWFMLGQRADAAALAERLGVPVPDAWRAR